MPKKQRSPLREWTEAILVALVLALFIRTFFVQAFKIPSGSMLETLQIGDHLLVNKLAYDVRLPKVFGRFGEATDFLDLFLDTAHGVRLFDISDPKRGDIIVFEYPQNPSQDFIKRIIGLPGETVEIRDKVVYIDGEPLEESYTRFVDPRIEWGPRDNWGPKQVPEGSYFCLGDNRDESRDSRFWGFVDRGAIVGKALIFYWSWDSENFRPRWNRMLRLVDHIPNPEQ